MENGVAVYDGVRNEVHLPGLHTEVRMTAQGTAEKAGQVAPERLSERESEIMSLIGEGLSNAEIASRLYLSINTVKTHIRGAYRKLGLARRVEAVLWVSRHREVGEADLAPDGL